MTRHSPSPISAIPDTQTTTMLTPAEIVLAHLTSSRARSASEIGRLCRLSPADVRKAIRTLAAQGQLERDIADLDGKLSEVWGLAPKKAAPPRPALADALAKCELDVAA
jgi:DNA-binding CsgD family transcriptional regulator